MFRRCIVTAIGLVVASAATVRAQTCVPLSEGVPGTATFQRAPNWWYPPDAFPLYDTRIDAPGWVRALAHSHPFGGNGSVEDMQFRMLHRSDGGVEYLYLSWSAKTVPDLNVAANNTVWFGFQDAGAGTKGIAIKIALNVSTAETAALMDGATNTYNTAISTYDGANWTAYAPGGGAAATPHWINGTGNTRAEGSGRMWIDTTLKRWGVNIRVPMSAVATQTNLDSGINIGSTFKFWYEFRISTPNAPNGAGFVPYKWPPGVDDMDPVNDRPTDPAGGGVMSKVWETLKLSNAGTFDPPDPTCSTGGVTFTRDDIGSDYPLDSTGISLSATNTFHANLHNTSTSQANGLKARFRIANWGSGATWEDVPNPTSTLWQDIADSNGVPQPNGISIVGKVDNTITTGSITTAYTVNNFCDKCMYGVFYNPNKAQCDMQCSATTNNSRLDHQCLLVDLTGAGVVFINTSAYQNMNYKAASSFSEPAEINVSNLPGFAGGKDVYLYVQALNMPAKAPPGTPGLGKLPIPGWPPSAGGAPAETGNTNAGGVVGQVDQPNLARVPVSETRPTARTRTDQLIAGLNMAVAQGLISSEQLALNMPTVIVRAYYDTGVKNTAGGGSRPILKPLTSFGYYVVHDGDIGGWNLSLQGAQQLAPNWYRVAVGPTGKAIVTTVVESLPPTRPVPWLWIVITLGIIVLLLVILLARRRAHP